MSNSKKHHYVPEAYLRNFARTDSPDQIWVFDKLKSRQFSSAVRDTGSEGNFNTIEVNGNKINLEPIFDRVDALGPPLIRSLIEAQRVDHFNQEQRRNLTSVVAVQILRAKIHRLSYAHTMEQLGESARKVGWNPEEFANYGIPSEVEAKILSFRSLESVDDLAKEIGSKICVLHKVSDAPLWTSDNPVVTNNSFPYGDVGIKSPGIEIYFPLSTQFILAFYCPTISEKIRHALASGEALRDREYFYRLFQGMREGCAVESSEQLESFNSLQVAQSHRFVFGPIGEFSLAERMLQEHPNLSQVKGRFSVGPMGQVPKRESMPPGTHLVLIGNLDHLMLPVVSWLDEPEGAEFEVTVLCSRIPDGLRKEESFETVTVFDDGYEVRMIRGAVLEFKDEGELSKIRVLFLDKAMNSLSTAIRRRNSSPET